MKKMSRLLLMSLLLTVIMCSTAFAGTWKQDDRGWWWMEARDQYPASAWEWIDGNDDGIAECYYFDGSGYLLTDTVTPDGFTVNRDGAWVENGAVKLKAMNPSAKLYLADEGRRIYEAASQKTSQLGSLDTRAKMDMTMSLMGQSIGISMDMDMKYKDLNTGNMKLLMQMTMNMLGQTISGTMFYTDGYYYMDMEGQKIKMASNVDEMLQEMRKTMDLSKVDTSYMKNFQVTADSNGNTIVTYEVDSEALMEQLSGIYAMMGINTAEVGMSFRDMRGTDIINPDGYCLSEKITMVMDMAVEGETISTSMNMDLQYINPGQPVDFKLPSTAGYEDTGSYSSN